MKANTIVFDIGSTYTKAVAYHLKKGSLCFLAAGQAPTTLSDVAVGAELVALGAATVLVEPVLDDEPAVVGASVVVKTSLSANGTPASGDASGSPAATCLSTAAAAASASWAPTCRKAW